MEKYTVAQGRSSLSERDSSREEIRTPAVYRVTHESHSIGTNDAGSRAKGKRKTDGEQYEGKTERTHRGAISVNINPESGLMGYCSIASTGKENIQ